MCGYDLPEQGLEMLTLFNFDKKCEPFEDEVITRVASICPHLAHLELSEMYTLTETGRLSMVSLLRQII